MRIGDGFLEELPRDMDFRKHKRSPNQGRLLDLK